MFLAAIGITTLAAIMTVVTPTFGLFLGTMAVVLVAFDLRRRIVLNWNRKTLIEAIDSSRRSASWEDVVGVPGAMKVEISGDNFLGHPSEAWLEPNFLSSILHPNDQRRSQVVSQRARDDELRHNLIFRARSGDGHWCWVELRANPVRNRSGQSVIFAGVMTDRTDDIEKAQEADTLRRVVSESPLAHLIAERDDDSNFIVTSMNLAGEQLFKTPEDSAAGEPILDLLRALEGMENLCDLLVNQLELSLHAVEVSVVDEARMKVYEVLVQGIGHRCIALTFNDISERARNLEILKVHALHDALTGLPNRRFLAERLTHELGKGEEFDSSTSLITLDLNEFKEVNDALGHEIGDRLLVSIAERLVENAPPESMVARLGGDEFAVLLPDTSVAEAKDHADRLAKATRELVVLDGLNLQISASMGLVAAPEHGNDSAELMRLADVAMYGAKRAGRDVSIYDHADNPFSKRRVRLLGELEMGFESGDFEVFYQPILDLKSGQTVGAEGLLRWRHPELGIIPPGEFVELAEVTGAIGKLSRLVIRQVLVDSQTIQRAGFNINMSCNLSTRNLFEFDFVDAVREIIGEFGLPESGLRMEITESDLMDDLGRAQDVLRELSHLGATIAIDDFGTGHSSLERLRDLPVDCVKIDQGFVSSMLDGPRSQTLLRDIITMLENLGFTTVAEGIEDSASAELLKEFGCRQGQGFLWSRPVPLADFIGYLAAERVAPVTQLGSREKAKS